MFTNKYDINCQGAYKTPLYEWLPGTEPDSVLYIIHGMAEHGKRYAPVAEMLNRQSIAVYAHDGRYHGEAVSDTAQLGLADNNWFYLQIEDIKCVLDFLRKKYSGKKIFLLGHSMGSFLCQRFFQMYGNSIDGLILSASNGKEDPLMQVGIALAYCQYKLLGRQHRSHFINTLSFGQFNKAFRPNRTPFDWLSKDDAEVDKYIADPLCGFVCSSCFFYYFFKGIHDAFKKENIASIPCNIPIYCFAGSRDPVGLNGKGFLQLVQNWKNTGASNLHYKLYEEGRHEMLNETNKTEVMQDLIYWLKQNV